MGRSFVSAVLVGPRRGHQCSMLNDMNTWSCFADNPSTSANINDSSPTSVPFTFGALQSMVFVFFNFTVLSKPFMSMLMDLTVRMNAASCEGSAKLAPRKYKIEKLK